MMAAGATAWRPCDFQSGLSDFFESAREVLDKVSRGYAAMSRSHGHHSSWEGSFGGRKGPVTGAAASSARRAAGGRHRRRRPGPRRAGATCAPPSWPCCGRDPVTATRSCPRSRSAAEGAWRPSPGAVYPALSQLADEGLIAAEESGSKRVFNLTDAGREYVTENPEMARGAWESSRQQEAWQVPALDR